MKKVVKIAGNPNKYNEDILYDWQIEMQEKLI